MQLAEVRLLNKEATPGLRLAGLCLLIGWWRAKRAAVRTRWACICRACTSWLRRSTSHSTSALSGASPPLPRRATAPAIALVEKALVFLQEPGVLRDVRAPLTERA